MEEKIKLLREKIIKELSMLEDGVHVKLDYDPIILDALFFKKRKRYLGMSKEFADDFSRDILAKIDFSNVDFKDFFSSGFNFTGLYNVYLNPHNVYGESLESATLNGVTFTESLDSCEINGANFTGSKKARLDPNTLAEREDIARGNIRIRDTVFTDVTFTEPFNNYVSLKNVDFSGSKGARLYASRLYDNGLWDCNLKDVIITGKIKCIISGTDFSGAKSEIFGFPTKIRINPQETDMWFGDTKFAGVVFTGPFENVIINNTDFTDSENAYVDLRKINNHSNYKNCNFTDATVINFNGRQMNISVDGKITDSIEEELDKLLNLEAQSSVIKKEELENARKKLIEENRNKLKNKLNELVKLVETSESLGIDPKHLYASIPIEQDLFLVKIDDHYEINRDVINTSLLRFLNLSLIDFTNVLVCGIDFRKSGARINPQTVYNKDISYCTLDNNNIKFFDNFDGVTMTGTNFDECDFKKKALRMV